MINVNVIEGHLKWEYWFFPLFHSKTWLLVDSCPLLVFFRYYCQSSSPLTFIELLQSVRLNSHNNPWEVGIIIMSFYSWKKIRGWRGFTISCELGLTASKWWNRDVSLADWHYILHRKVGGSGTSLWFKIFTLFRSWHIHFCLIRSWVKASI